MASDKLVVPPPKVISEAQPKKEPVTKEQAIAIKVS